MGEECHFSPPTHPSETASKRKQIRQVKDDHESVGGFLNDIESEQDFAKYQRSLKFISAKHRFGKTQRKRCRCGKCSGYNLLLANFEPGEGVTALDEVLPAECRGQRVISLNKHKRWETIARDLEVVSKHSITVGNKDSQDYITSYQVPLAQNKGRNNRGMGKSQRSRTSKQARNQLDKSVFVFPTESRLRFTSKLTFGRAQKEPSIASTLKQSSSYASASRQQLSVFPYTMVWIGNSNKTWFLDIDLGIQQEVNAITLIGQIFDSDTGFLSPLSITVKAPNGRKISSTMEYNYCCEWADKGYMISEVRLNIKATCRYLRVQPAAKHPHPVPAMRISVVGPREEGHVAEFISTKPRIVEYHHLSSKPGQQFKDMRKGLLARKAELVLGSKHTEIRGIMHAGSHRDALNEHRNDKRKQKYQETSRTLLAEPKLSVKTFGQNSCGSTEGFYRNSSKSCHADSSNADWFWFCRKSLSFYS